MRRLASMTCRRAVRPDGAGGGRASPHDGQRGVPVSRQPATLVSSSCWIRRSSRSTYGPFRLEAFDAAAASLSVQAILAHPLPFARQHGSVRVRRARGERAETASRPSQVPPGAGTGLFHAEPDCTRPLPAARAAFGPAAWPVGAAPGAVWRDRRRAHARTHPTLRAGPVAAVAAAEEAVEVAVAAAPAARRTPPLPARASAARRVRTSTRWRSAWSCRRRRLSP